jgi:hypothetical protein
MKFRIARVVVAFLSLSFSLAPLTVAQTSTQTASALPRLVRFGGTVKDLNGNPLTGVVGITFALYSEQSGGASLWLETQNVTADSNGHYTVLLGSTKPDGLPADLFTSEQAHWVGVQVSGQAEQPRVLLVSAPYALKAGDAETIGGLPPSAFVLAAPAIMGSAAAGSAAASTAEGVSPATVTDVTTTGGTADFLPIFSGAATVIDSAVFQTGTSPTAKIGINTATPATTLDLNGTGTVRGTLTLPATGAATATVGKDSQGLNLVASSFSSTSSTALNQTFRWQAEPTANDTAAPLGTLNLQYGLGATAPTETGLKLSSKGVLTFATGQTFPGTGDGTITAVTAGADLTGGGTTGAVTLNLNTTKVPLLASANTFTASQTIDGGLTATGTVKASDLTATATATAATLNATNASVSNTVTITSASGGPLTVTSNVAGATTTYSEASATTGEGWGIEGYTNSGDPAAYGVAGFANAPGSPIGVYGQADSTAGIGVFGQSSPTESATGGTVSGGGYSSGVWGDGGTSGPYGVIGTADAGLAGFFISNSDSYGLWVQNMGSGPSFIAGTGTTLGDLTQSAYCEIDNDGDIDCTGTKNAVVPVDGGKRIVAMSAIEAPQNWFEDAGEAAMVNGAAVVELDSTYIQTVSTGMKYQVFLTPYGDCKGLYVTNRTANSFEVHELGGGTTSLSFGYRIMALRKKYENVRFADHTHDLDPMKKLPGGHAAAKQQSHTPTKKPSLARPLTQTTAVR